MTEHFLDGAEVRPAAEEVSRERVPEDQVAMAGDGQVTLGTRP